MSNITYTPTLRAPLMTRRPNHRQAELQGINARPGL